MCTNVLIMCPHNAAKSVVAAAYLRRIAAQRSLNPIVDTAGTDPDPEVLPVVREQLERDGYAVDHTPRALRANDLHDADRIINIGCSRRALDTDTPVTDWGIPNFSEDPSAAFAALAEHVEALATELS